jgi:hypothetical protein
MANLLASKWCRNWNSSGNNCEKYCILGYEIVENYRRQNSNSRRQSQRTRHEVVARKEPLNPKLHDVVIFCYRMWRCGLDPSGSGWSKVSWHLWHFGLHKRKWISWVNERPLSYDNAPCNLKWPSTPLSNCRRQAGTRLWTTVTGKSDTDLRSVWRLYNRSNILQRTTSQLGLFYFSERVAFSTQRQNQQNETSRLL